MTTRKLLFLLQAPLWVLVGTVPQASGQTIRLGAQVGTLSLPSATTGKDQLNRIATNGRDRVLVSEATTRDLLLFTPDGRLLSTSSLLADHLASPGGMAFLSRTTFAVMDRGRPQALWARLSHDSAVLVAEGKALIGASSGACSLNGTFVLAGFEGTPEKSHILHEIDGHGSDVHSFGTPLGGNDSAAWASRLVLVPSLIACSSAGADIIIASQVSGEVRAITRQGRVRWSFTPPDIAPMTFVKPSSREMRFVWPADSLWDKVETIFTPAPGVVAFQVARRFGIQADSALSVTTYFLEMQSGRVISTQSDLPLVRAVLPERLYTTGENLRPVSLEIHAFHWGAR